VDFHCSDDPKVAVSGRLTLLFYRHDATCQTSEPTVFLREPSCP